MRKKNVAAVVILSLIMAILRTVIIINNMETNYNNSTYYLPDRFLPNAFTAVALVLIPAMFIYASVSNKGFRPVLESNDLLSATASCTLGFILLGCFAVFAKQYVSDFDSLAKYSTAVAVLAALSAVVFLFLGVKPQSGKLSAILGLLPMLFTLARLFSDFLSSTSAPFANSGAYHLMSLCFLLLFFLCENKSHVEMGSASLFFGFGFVSIFLLLVYALPNVVLHCMGFGVFKFGFASALSVADLVAAFYVAAKLSSAKLVPLKKSA